jgi:hypothetical protein
VKDSGRIEPSYPHIHPPKTVARRMEKEGQANRLDHLTAKEELIMPLTRSFRETVRARAHRDIKFRQALLGETIQALLDGNLEEGVRRCARASTPRSVSKNSARRSADRPRA